MLDIKKWLLHAKNEIPELFRNDSTIIDYANKLSNNAEIISNYSKGKLEGFIAFYLGDSNPRGSNDKFAFITFLYVATEFRRQGVAELLIESTINKINNHGINICRLEVNKNNTNAIKLYTKYNFSVIHELEHSWIMEKVI